MQLLLIKKVALALLALHSHVPSADGAVTELSQAPEVSGPKVPFWGALVGRSGRGSQGGSAGSRKRPTHDRVDTYPGVTKIETLGYEVEEKETTLTEDSYRVWSPPFTSGSQEKQEQIDDLRINREEGAIIIDDARNNNDPTTDRARLFQVAMSAFVYSSSMEPSDLIRVDVESIDEETTKPAIEYARPRKANAESFSISSKAESGVDPELFALFMSTTFGKFVGRMLTKFPVGKKVARIDVSPSLGEDDSSVSFILE